MTTQKMDSKLNKKQLSCIKQFCEFTCTSNKKMAQDILKDVKWNVEQAVEVFYTNYGGIEPPSEEPVSTKSKASVDTSEIKGL